VILVAVFKFRRRKATDSASILLKMTLPGEFMWGQMSRAFDLPHGSEFLIGRPYFTPIREYPDHLPAGTKSEGMS
jgi:hypothetical protein